MRTDRRGFLRMIGGLLALGPDVAPAASAGPSAPAIHRKTRNGRFGTLGKRARRILRPGRRFKRYPGAAKRTLAPAAEQPSLSLAAALERYSPAPSFESTPLALGELGRLLYYANGVTGALDRGRNALKLRAAPSAGALYAGEVYVVADRVSGLAPGVYYYATGDHALVTLRTGSFMDRVRRAVERPAQLANAAAVVLLTNVFHRYAVRYGNRGYRYALIDSGHIGANLQLAATSAGVAETSPLRFEDDRLNDLLQVDGYAEAVCAIHALGDRAAAPSAPAPAVRRLLEKQQARPGAILRRSPMPERYHDATKLVASPAERGAPASAPPRRTARPTVLSASRPEATVEQAIRRRRSAVSFPREPVTRSELDFLIETAVGHAALERAPGVELHLAVHRVTDLAPGLYRYAAEKGGLASSRSGDWSDPLTRASLRQRKGGDAAVAFLMAGPLSPSVSPLGDRRYRDLLLECGGIAERIYLASEALGLATCNLAAFLDDDLNDLVGLDGIRRAVLHVTVIGHRI